MANIKFCIKNMLENVLPDALVEVLDPVYDGKKHTYRIEIKIEDKHEQSN